MKMIRISLVSRDQKLPLPRIVAQGQISMCHNAGVALDVLLRDGWILRLEEFDPDKEPISKPMRRTFLKICEAAQAHAFALAHSPLHVKE